jgi:hypothetical protein
MLGSYEEIYRIAGDDVADSPSARVDSEIRGRARGGVLNVQSHSRGNRGDTVRWLARVAILLAVSLALLYAADWAVLRIRLSHGTAYRTVAVNQFLATPLKGNKVEYDWTGTVQQTCSRSIFPQAGNSACWWLERHTSQWQ